MSFAKERNRTQTATSAAKPAEPPKPTRPWREAELTAPPPGYVPTNPGERTRWVRVTDKHGNDRLEAKLDEGWQLWRKPKGANGKSGGDANVDATDISGCAVRRGLVFMVLPPERAAARAYYHWELNAQKVAALKDQKTEEKMGTGE